MKSRKDSQTEMIKELYNVYRELRKTMSHTEAMVQFNYLHSITLARLKRYIKDNESIFD